MRQYLLATTPGGRTYRMGEDGPRADQVLEDFTDSDSVPGGFKDLTGSLPRKPGVDYGDMQRGTKIELFGAGQMKVWEGRLERAPKVSGDRLVVAPAAVGYEAHLTDDSSAQEIFIDSDMGAWGEPSTRRRASFATNVKLNQNAQSQLVPAGDPSGATSPSISHNWAQMNNSGGAGRDAAESWYDGGGVQLGKVILDFINVKGPPDTNWVNSVNANETDFGGNEGHAFDVLFDFDATTTLGKALSIASNRFFLSLEDYYALSVAGEGSWEVQWRNIRVLGRHGLTTYGTWPQIGVLASDVVPYALSRWAPLLNFTTGPNGTIRPSSFPISQLAFKEPTTVADMINQATRYELPEWGVWAGQNGPTFYMNRRGEREGRKRWRARVRPAQLEDTGQQMDRVWNGVIVQGQGTDGSTLFVGPTGSGLRVTDVRLLDTDPLNPANEIPGLKRYVKIQMKGIATIEGMIEAGEAFLEQTKLLDGSGKATLTGYVEDEHGMFWPYYCVHAGDLIEFLDSSIPGYRYIVNASRSRASRSVSIDIDAPPDSYEALMERLNAEFVGVGLSA
jgi:hypothetical protein